MIQLAQSADSIVTKTAKEPEVSRRIGPTYSLASSSWSVTRSRASQCSVRSLLASDV